jgi:hypothetical protein
MGREMGISNGGIQGRILKPGGRHHRQGRPAPAPSRGCRDGNITLLLVHLGDYTNSEMNDTEPNLQYSLHTHRNNYEYKCRNSESLHIRML